MKKIFEKFLKKLLTDRMKDDIIISVVKTSK